MLTLARLWNGRSLILGSLLVSALALHSYGGPTVAGLAIVQVGSDGTVVREIAGAGLVGVIALIAAAVVVLLAGLRTTPEAVPADEAEGTRRAIEEANARLNSSIGAVLDIVRATLTSTSKYSSLIDTAERDLRRDSRPDAIKRTLEMMHERNAEISGEVDILKGRLEQAKAESEQLRKELQAARSESFTDGLTGLKNRKWFDECLSEEINTAHESAEKLSLAIVDIDHFKRINDDHGHPTGDKILAWFGSKIVENIKGRDRAARYGGEEFAIILPDTPLQSAATVMDQIRASVEQVTWKHIKSGRRFGKVTASFGVAELRDGEPASSLVERADENLYAAKSEGRNRVVAR